MKQDWEETKQLTELLCDIVVEHKKTIDKLDIKSKEELELDSYLGYLNSAMAPFEMKKLKSLINAAIKSKMNSVD
jgi:hypothetical protein